MTAPVARAWLFRPPILSKLKSIVPASRQPKSLHGSHKPCWMSYSVCWLVLAGCHGSHCRLRTDCWITRTMLCYGCVRLLHTLTCELHSSCSADLDAYAAAQDLIVCHLCDSIMHMSFSRSNLVCLHHWNGLISVPCMRPVAASCCRSDAALADLNIKTVEDLGSWKYAAWADALVTLAEYENADFSS